MAERYALDGRRVWVAGHRGMVGSAVVRRLAGEACSILSAPHNEVDLRDQAAVNRWVKANRPDTAIICAATVGGILANSTRPAEFLYDNLMIEANTIQAALENGVEKLLFLGSSCIYPKLAPQPIPELALLSGPLEPTNQWYAIAKIAGLKLCEAYRQQYGVDFISAMPTSLYGPGDNFRSTGSHVIPALIRRAHEARQSGAAQLVVWGTGKPRREFLHVDDLADALVFIVKTYSDAETINVGVGSDMTIAEVARAVCDVVGFSGGLVFDASKLDGTPRKLLDMTKLTAMGWRPRIEFHRGLGTTYEWFLANVAAAA